MRKSCKECTIKHLSACLVLLNEIPNYPRSKYFIIGNLNEAEEESRHLNPEFADEIREIRRMFMQEGDIKETTILSLLDAAEKMSEECNFC